MFGKDILLYILEIVRFFSLLDVVVAPFARVVGCGFRATFSCHFRVFPQILVSCSVAESAHCFSWAFSISEDDLVFLL